MSEMARDYLQRAMALLQEAKPLVDVGGGPSVEVNEALRNIELALIRLSAERVRARQRGVMEMYNGQFTDGYDVYGNPIEDGI